MAPSREGDMTESSGLGVSARAASKRYGSVTALDRVDLDFAPGHFVVLLGPSGSGKSTLARCLAGVERLDGGALYLGGQLVGDGKRHLPPERRNLAMVFQDYALWPHLTALGNVSYALRRRHLPGAEGRERVMAALERVGLSGLADRYPHELSGGEQQRVALARAVVARPGLLIFDEPLSNLDADLRERLRVEIATITRDSGASAVYITHDQSEAFALADEMAVLDGGHIVQFAPPEEIYRRPATPFVARFTGLAGELPGRVASIDRPSIDRTGVDETGDVTVDVGLTRLRARNGGRLRRGDRAAVFVRPAATRIVAASGDTGNLPGVVVDVAYRGRGYDHVVVCEVAPLTGGTLTAVSLTAVFAAHRHERGERVTVEFDPDGCVAYPYSGTDSPPADLMVRDGAELTAVSLAAANLNGHA
jgi:iron(III) transport system ATP-binding protein